MEARPDAEALRDAYLIALGRQLLREADERCSQRHANFDPAPATRKPRGKAR